MSKKIPLEEKISEISNNRFNSLRKKFISFSAFLFTLIFITSGWGFFIAMKQMIKHDAHNELEQVVKLEQANLKALVRSKVEIVLKMASSPLLTDYFFNPQDTLYHFLAMREIASYREALHEDTLYWVNDSDKVFYFNDAPRAYNPVIIAGDPDFDWYYSSLNLSDGKKYILNVDHDKKTQTTKLWINAPVKDSQGNPLGVVGASIDLSSFISELYRGYRSHANVYFFNAQGEITAARDTNIVAQEAHLSVILGIDESEIITRIENLSEDVIEIFTSSAGEIAIASISGLDWYIAAVIPNEIGNYGKLFMILFGVMFLLIIFVFAAFNAFVGRLLSPLQKMVASLSMISSEWNSPSNLTARNDEVGAIARCICEFFDKNKKLSDDVYHDPLTEIYNRRFLEINLDRIIKEQSRSGSNLSLLFIDIDFFKKYNDTYGHGEGDECLKSVAKALAQSLQRENDFVARYGGEEFVVVLPDTDKDGALNVAQTLLENVRAQNIPHEKNEAAACVTISMGVTTGQVKHTQTGEDYLKRADECLYKSKQNGRNRFTFEDLL